MTIIMQDIRDALDGDSVPRKNIMLSKAYVKIDELCAALEKLRSYNVDIIAERINYRPHDHISVIDAALRPMPTSNRTDT